MHAGTMDTWVQLTASSGPGPPKPAGEIHCVFSFEGPVGVAYPQYQPGVDSFDDSLRENLKVRTIFSTWTIIGTFLHIK